MPEVMVNGTKVHYLEKKGRGSSTNIRIIFIHGSGGNACLWKKVMDALSGEFDSMAVDLPGHGKSEGAGLGNIAGYREFLKGFMNALGLERVVLAGHSMGGFVAANFADRFPAQTAGVVLLDSGEPHGSMFTARLPENSVPGAGMRLWAMAARSW